MEHQRESSTLLSIVIPTRDRASYAISAIESILEISDAQLELVIHDNSESPVLESYIRDNSRDSRLRFRYAPRPLSFVANFDAAVGMATGQYVCVIGDDDGVNPEIMAAAAWMKSNHVDCLAVRTAANYLWQGTGVSSTLFTNVRGGSLSVFNFRGATRCADTEKEMRKFVRNGGTSYLDLDLPKLYHGLVHRRCLNAVHEKTGAYFGGLSPDIFASLAIACVADRVVVTDYPLTIPGASASSGSVVEGSLKRHSRRLEDAPHLRNRGVYNWSDLVPRVYSVQTIWADSGIAALRAMGRTDLVSQLNQPKLAAYCVAANHGVMRPVLRHLFKSMRDRRKNPAVGLVQFIWCLGTGPGRNLASRGWNRLLMILGRRSVHRIYGLKSMAEVSHALADYLNGKCLRFADGRPLETK